jgi:N-acetylglucosaminyl-diphospho-decaprenol L-rhamnosyltransferase
MTSPLPSLHKRSSGLVAIVVAAHKKCYPLERCLESLQPLLSHPADLIFVDNGSQEMLHAWAADRFPNITVTRLPENQFFCGGYNAGIRIAINQGVEFVLIMNADTEVIDPGFLTGLLKAARRWPRAAFIGPLVYFRSRGMIQKTWLRFPNVLRSTLVWLPWRLTGHQETLEIGQERIVEFLNGVCVLCRVSALEEFGLMDEAFGGYVEDADWSWRARQKGWTSLFTPVPSVIHHEEAMGYESYSLKTFLLKRNTVLWFLKAGRRLSAQTYAFASIGLARIRMAFDPSGDQKTKHQYFIQQLRTASLGLLNDRSMGDWFGPPLTNWRSF